MKQYKITTQTLDFPQPDDCVLPPDDPLHAIRKASMLGNFDFINETELSRGEQIYNALFRKPSE